MTAMDRLVRETLTAAADNDVHVERLLSVARSRGRRYRRRERLTSLTGSLAAVLAITITGVALLSPPGAPPVGPSPSASPFTGIPTGPFVPGAASLLDNPAALDDPTLFHLTIDGTPPLAVQAADYTHDVVGGEGMVVAGTVDGRPNQIRIMATRYENVLDVPHSASHPGTVAARPAVVFDGLPAASAPPAPGEIPRPSAGPSGPATLAVRWSPVDGVWLQLQGAFAEPDLLSLAARVRVDRAFRCGPSFRVPAPPAGWKWQRCALTFDRGELDMAIMNASSAAGPFVFTTYNTQSFPAWTGESPGAPVSTNIGGRPALVSDEGLTIELRKGHARWVMTAPDQTTAQSVAGTVVLGDLDPRTWP